MFVKSTWLLERCISVPAYRLAELYIHQRYIDIFLRKNQEWRVVELFFFLHNVLFQILFVRGKRDKYSLWQTKINGWVQKCREQAVEEDVGSTGHRRTACMCQWKYTLTWTENSCDTFTVIISWNLAAESSHTNFLNADELYLLWAVLTMMVMKKVYCVY